MWKQLGERATGWSTTVFGSVICAAWVALAQTLPAGCKEALGSVATYGPAVLAAIAGTLLRGSKRFAFLILIPLLSSCMLGTTYQATNFQEALAQTKELEPNGCLYIRGNSRPYADVSTLFIAAYGKRAPKYDECLKLIPPDARILIGTN